MQQNIKNILMIICFDGKNYHGWQIQKNAVTVQEIFQKNLYRILEEKVEIKGCSRTDSGVHANEYAISFRTSSQISPEGLLQALNCSLPRDISILQSLYVPEEFHARYSCKKKEYIYKIWNNPVRNPFLENRALHYWYKLPLEKLNKAAKNFIGEHDFTAFSTLDKREQKNMIREVYDFKISEKNGIIEMKVTANGFLYNMVRIMVGTLLAVAQNKITPEEIPKIIASKDRKLAGDTAPAHGLYLNKIFYNEVKL